MVLEQSCEQESTNVCQSQIPEKDKLKPPQPFTLGRLLNELNLKLKDEKEVKPNSQAVKDLEASVTAIDKEYNGITKIIQDYQKDYESLQNQFYKDVQLNYEGLKQLTDNLGESWLKAIENLRQEKYEGRRDRDNKHPKIENTLIEIRGTLIKEQKNLNEIKNCLDQSIEWEKKVKQYFEFFKDYKKKVTDQLKDLEDLYTKAHNDFINTPNKDYKAVYACYLEGKHIWADHWEEYCLASIWAEYWQETFLVSKEELLKDKLHNLNQQNSEWLKEKLTQSLVGWIHAAYQHFWWQKRFDDQEEAVARAWEDYKEFKDKRRDQFIREAQDIPPLENGDGDC